MIKSVINIGSVRLLAAAAVAVLLAGCAAQSPAPVRQTGSPPGTATAAQVPGEVQRLHVVRPGDTLMGIGRLYGQNVNDLVAWNALSNPNQLRIGQEIRVSPPSAAAGGVGTVAIAQPIDMTGQAGAASSAGSTPVYEEPRGGRQPYSDQAWAAVRPDAAPSAAAAAPSETVPPPAATGTGWLWPASGPIIARFDEATNKGVGIGGNPGDPVVASAAGSVVYAGSGLRGYGKLVIIKHDDEYLTAYAHNQNLLVKEGDTITRGQRIAELGSTDTDRPKLHFEIRRQGRPVDPMQYLPPR
ncbi:MAG TPA: peptidoglycan DD-metalloendopeptidase family protein [Azoarcus taiwanensis]|uniref:Peptidoglycan DD-metalloendopeptidase family protein n=1 Tax=Azoarcus taiwanensis TaxID=666964 RepID=A0A972F8N3_9RHOO|nr:peptidoglycan DD-metalloendopeptidase family protein [Azoarcus taiwanensis]NMG04204.1 peptidoglycan DD-metalloendopeptidase family protein [Azoarcus taiwanensis]HRQ57764.1 peptidoglycan DD-metalloendopeptidase family protein [Azoarcus taiwanensis]